MREATDKEPEVWKDFEIGEEFRLSSQEKISGEENQVNESAEVPIMQEVQKRSSGNLRLLQAFLNCSGYRILTQKNSFCASVVLKKWNSPV
ncbi:hypothetical protein DW977_04305 [Ruminococcus sp. AM49-10BH]|nr:hypothetical protein DW977_04305 [Ruminococcus sp. AM49-10BH]